MHDIEDCISFNNPSWTNANLYGFYYILFLSGNPVLDAWTGACKWASSSDLSLFSITRKDYDEMGEGYIREHRASNQYFPTPDSKFK